MLCKLNRHDFLKSKIDDVKLNLEGASLLYRKDNKEV